MNENRAWRAALCGFVGFAAIAGSCAFAQTQSARQWQLRPENGLGAMIDCLEESDRTLISAHRGGPGPGLPENAIATMDALLTDVPVIMEVDVTSSRDGVHFLLHDRTLDRTTTGTGNATEQDWGTIQQLYLKDQAGWVTPYRVPSLEEALAWAKGRTALQIDFKTGADEAEIVRLIRATEMADQVILISYTREAALRLHALAPEMLISYSADDLADIAAATAAGLPADRIIAFTGTRMVRPDLYAVLEKQDVEVIFGTLGRSPEAFDVVIDRYGLDARYAELGRIGVDILATDRPREAANALAEAERLPQAGQCGINRPD